MDIDCSFLSELNLKEAFKDIEVIRGITKDEDYLNILFEHSRRSQIFICDSKEKGYSCVVYDTAGLGRDKTFIIDNDNHRDVYLMRIDGVLFSKKSKCDCAFIASNEMVFIEFKSDAINRLDKSLKAQYEKCYKQLKTTVLEFDERYKSIGQAFRSKFENIAAYAVFNPTVPSNNAFAKILSARFAKELKMKLCFASSKRID